MEKFSPETKCEIKGGDTYAGYRSRAQNYVNQFTASYEVSSAPVQLDNFQNMQHELRQQYEHLLHEDKEKHKVMVEKLTKKIKQLKSNRITKDELDYNLLHLSTAHTNEVEKMRIRQSHALSSLEQRISHRYSKLLDAKEQQLASMQQSHAIAKSDLERQVHDLTEKLAMQSLQLSKSSTTISKLESQIQNQRSIIDTHCGQWKRECP